jgi:hypothetical protein
MFRRVHNSSSTKHPVRAYYSFNYSFAPHPLTTVFTSVGHFRGFGTPEGAPPYSRHHRHVVTEIGRFRSRAKGEGSARYFAAMITYLRELGAPGNSKCMIIRHYMDLSRFLRQPVKTQFSSNGELCHGIVS